MEAPGNIWGFAMQSLAGLGAGRRAGQNPAGLVVGGGGIGVGEQEEVPSYLREASVGAEMAGGGSPVRKSGRQRHFLAAAVLR